MYDAIEDPYTYKNSTVLVNKLDLRNQAELDAFEAEISSARADEPLPDGRLDFSHYKAIHHHLFQDVYGGRGRFVRSEYRKVAIHFAFLKTSKVRPAGYSTICDRQIFFGTSMRKRSQTKPLISWQS